MIENNGRNNLNKNNKIRQVGRSAYAFRSAYVYTWVICFFLRNETPIQRNGSFIAASEILTLFEFLNLLLTEDQLINDGCFLI